MDFGNLDDVRKQINQISEAMKVPMQSLYDVAKDNPAQWTYERLTKYIKEFENELDDEHEVGARLVSFGNAVTFYISKLGYYGPDIICFYGVGEKGEKFQLIQNISQLSVLLMALPKLEKKVRRIGFEPNIDSKK
jgi:hypothetical protein